MRISGVSGSGASVDDEEAEEDTSMARISREQLEVKSTTFFSVCEDNSFVGAMITARVT